MNTGIGEALLDVIVREKDETARLAYIDWLYEQGYNKHANFVKTYYLKTIWTNLNLEKIHFFMAYKSNNTQTIFETYLGEINKIVDIFSSSVYWKWLANKNSGNVESEHEAKIQVEKAVLTHQNSSHCLCESFPDD